MEFLLKAGAEMQQHFPVDFFFLILVLQTVSTTPSPTTTAAQHWYVFVSLERGAGGSGREEDWRGVQSGGGLGL